MEKPNDPRARVEELAQTKLSEPEMQNLVDQLFACNVAEVAPNGKKIFAIISMDDISNFLNLKS